MDSHPAVVGGKAEVLHRAAQRHVRHAPLNTDRGTNVRAPEMTIGEFPPFGKILPVRSAGKRKPLNMIRPKQEIGNVADDDIVIRNRRHRRWNGMPVGQHVDKQFLVRKPFLQQAGKLVGEGDVTVRQGHIGLVQSLPLQTPGFTLRVIPGTAPLADAVPAVKAVAR